MKKSSRKWWFYSVTALLSFATVVAVGFLRPDQLHNALIAADVMGWTEASQEERTRINKIMTLTIKFEQKQALVNRTVFIGATNEMVFLALGTPKKSVTVPARNGVSERLIWQYHFPGDNRPTIFEFENDKLITAYKVSTIDVNLP